MKISVVIPTIADRADWLTMCVAAYRDTCPHVEILVVPNDDASCGEGWIKGARRATGDYLHFTADDAVPLDGWWQAAVKVADSGAIPVAHCLTALDGLGEWNEDSAMYAPAWLDDVTPTPNVLFPFFTRAMFEANDDGAHWLAPIHYGSDDWVTFLAHRRGIDTVECPGYRLGHFAAPEGRLFESRMRDIPILCDLMAPFGVPNAYAVLGCGYGWNPAEVAA